MPPELTALKNPIAIHKDYVVDQPSTFRIQQQGKALSGGQFIVFRENELAGSSPGGSQALISIRGKYGSATEKRAFFDASGLPLLTLYHKPVGVTWYIELPGGHDTAIARLAPRFSIFKDKLDVDVRNATIPGEEVTLHVRGQDIWKQRTNVYVGSAIVMTAKRTDKLSTYLPGRRPDWMVEIAAGMDILLASAIMVVLASTMYNSSMKSSSS
ncbi:hypothetical protein M433DRAFT_115129 [Acidomyces richmondensis BFW]|nr:hypothetical protein M433DRAFT_115129 [Acidomyces richmondensis BFW]